jgi:threonine synthase
MNAAVTGLTCSVCGTHIDIATPFSWKCPNATNEDRKHVLRFDVPIEAFRPTEDANPFLAYRSYLAVDAFGEAIGLDDATREGIIRELDDAVKAVDGVGFTRTPMHRADALSDALGFTADGGIWVKDETHNVAGSHKARHLFTELVHLVMAERAGVAPWKSAHNRPMLAIASCGNAAIAASTLAAAVQWPIAVHVPTAASPSVIAKLESLNADIRVCPRLDSDPAGDPCVWRFRELVAAGAIPFGVQGTENAWCLDGGRTIGWEMLKEIGHRVDRIFIQVGGGAFASSIASSMRNVGTHPKLHAVQTEGCAPLARAWNKALQNGGTRDAGGRWADCMWAWETEPHSLADGILDDETYDWIGILDGMSDTGGSPIVAAEELVVRAHQMAHEFTDISVSPTGSAGLAGVLQIRDSIANDERIVVVFSGILR